MRFKTIVVSLFCFAIMGHVVRVSGEELRQFTSSVDERLSAARSLPPAQRDAALRKLASDRATQDDAVAALRALSYVSRPSELAAGLSDLRLISGGGSDPHAPLNGLPRKPSQGGPRGAAGGNSLADFAPLMELIQTTVVPDTWETLGGPSTMSPYIQGIIVDQAGVVQDAVMVTDGDLLNNIEVMLNEGESKAKRDTGVGAWRLATPYRCVSLSRLSQEVLRRRLSGIAVDDEVRNMAGLSRVQYLILDPKHNDIILVGPVGGIESRHGWLCDQKSGQVPLRLDYFAAAAASIFANQPFGCTIDPTQESLAAAAKIADQIRSGDTPIGLAAEALRTAMGHQNVIVFGTAGDTPLGYMMVQADRHMKQLALGVEPMPTGVPNYLNVVSRHLDQGAPDGLLLRLWFTGSPIAVRVDQTGNTFELAGRPLKLASETKLAAQDGGRLATEEDFRITEFVSGFNAHFDEIASLHPIYGALQSVFSSAAVAEVVRRGNGASWLPRILGPMLLDDASLGVLTSPRKVESIATLHRAVYRSKRYSIIIASGGVVIDTQDTVEQTLRPYASLVSVRDRFDTANNGNESNWWWNAK